MTSNTDTKIFSIDMKRHYVTGVPWLMGREKGEDLGKLNCSEGGLNDVENGNAVRLLIPADCGISMSFFEGFLLLYCKRVFEADPGLRLVELISIEVDGDDGSDRSRLRQSEINLGAALTSLIDFWQSCAVMSKKASSV